MRLLLDTHALVWYVDQEHLLSRASHSIISDPANDLFVSAGSIWELAIKVGLGKLGLSSPYRQWMTQALADLRPCCCQSPSSMRMCKSPCPSITAIRLIDCSLPRRPSKECPSSAGIRSSTNTGLPVFGDGFSVRTNRAPLCKDCRFKLAGHGKTSWAYPVVTGGRLYIRDQQSLTAYDVKAK